MKKKTLLLYGLVLLSGPGIAKDSWQKAYPISELTPKRKIGGLVRFNDPSFFYAEQGFIGMGITKCRSTRIGWIDPDGGAIVCTLILMQVCGLPTK